MASRLLDPSVDDSTGRIPQSSANDGDAVSAELCSTPLSAEVSSLQNELVSRDLGLVPLVPSMAEGLGRGHPVLSAQALRQLSEVITSGEVPLRPEVLDGVGVPLSRPVHVSASMENTGAAQSTVSMLPTDDGARPDAERAEGGNTIRIFLEVASDIKQAALLSTQQWLSPTAPRRAGYACEAGTKEGSEPDTGAASITQTDMLSVIVEVGSPRGGSVHNPLSKEALSELSHELAKGGGPLRPERLGFEATHRRNGGGDGTADSGGSEADLSLVVEPAGDLSSYIVRETPFAMQTHTDPNASGPDEADNGVHSPNVAHGEPGGVAYSTLKYDSRGDVSVASISTQCGTVSIPAPSGLTEMALHELAVEIAAGDMPLRPENLGSAGEALRRLRRSDGSLHISLIVEPPGERDRDNTLLSEQGSPTLSNGPCSRSAADFHNRMAHSQRGTGVAVALGTAAQESNSVSEVEGACPSQASIITTHGSPTIPRMPLSEKLLEEFSEELAEGVVPLRPEVLERVGSPLGVLAGAPRHASMSMIVEPPVGEREGSELLNQSVVRVVAPLDQTGELGVEDAAMLPEGMVFLRQLVQAPVLASDGSQRPSMRAQHVSASPSEGSDTMSSVVRFTGSNDDITAILSEDNLQRLKEELKTGGVPLRQEILQSFYGKHRAERSNISAGADADEYLRAAGARQRQHSELTDGDGGAKSIGDFMSTRVEAPADSSHHGSPFIAADLDDAVRVSRGAALSDRSGHADLGVDGMLSEVNHSVFGVIGPGQSVSSRDPESPLDVNVDDVDTHLHNEESGHLNRGTQNEAEDNDIAPVGRNLVIRSTGNADADEKDNEPFEDDQASISVEPAMSVIFRGHHQPEYNAAASGQGRPLRDARVPYHGSAALHGHADDVLADVQHRLKELRRMQMHLKSEMDTRLGAVHGELFDVKDESLTAIQLVKQGAAEALQTQLAAVTAHVDAQGRSLASRLDNVDQVLTARLTESYDTLSHAQQCHKESLSGELGALATSLTTQLATTSAALTEKVRHAVHQMEERLAQVDVLAQTLSEQNYILQKRLDHALKIEELPPGDDIPAGPKVRITIVIQPASGCDGVAAAREMILLPISKNATVGQCKREALRRARRQGIIDDSIVYSNTILCQGGVALFEDDVLGEDLGIEEQGAEQLHLRVAEGGAHRSATQDPSERAPHHAREARSPRIPLAPVLSAAPIATPRGPVSCAAGTAPADDVREDAAPYGEQLLRAFLLSASSATEIGEHEHMERRLLQESERMEREPLAHRERLERLVHVKNELNGARLQLLDRATYSTIETHRRIARQALQYLDNALSAHATEEEMRLARSRACEALASITGTLGEDERVEVLQEIIRGERQRKERVVGDIKELTTDVRTRLRIPSSLILRAQVMLHEGERAVLLAASMTQQELDDVHASLLDFVTCVREARSPC